MIHGTTVMQQRAPYDDGNPRIAAVRSKPPASKRTSLPSDALDRGIDKMIANRIATLAEWERVIAEAAQASVKSFASKLASLHGRALVRLTDQMIERGDRIAVRALAERAMAVKAARASAQLQ